MPLPPFSHKFWSPSSEFYYFRTLKLQCIKGQKGCGVDQAIATILQETKETLEDSNFIVLHLFFDFSSAFNSMEHKHVIQSTSRLKVRRNIFRLIASYLSERKMIVRWQDAYSERRDIKGLSGQGTLLSVILFNVSADPLMVEFGCHV